MVIVSSRIETSGIGATSIASDSGVDVDSITVDVPVGLGMNVHTGEGVASGAGVGFEVRDEADVGLNVRIGVTLASVEAWCIVVGVIGLELSEVIMQDATPTTSAI